LIQLKSYPIILSVGLTTRCNLSCIMCSQSVMRGGERFDMDDSLLEKIQPLLNLAQEVRWNENGELFSSPHVLKYLDLIKISGVPRNFVSTNFLRVERHLETLLECNITQLNISIDAASETTYEKIRQGAQWKLLIKNLTYLRNLKKERVHNFPRVVFTFIPMNLNLAEIPEFINFSHEFGADEIQFLKLAPAYTGWDQIPISQSEKELLSKASIIGKNLGISVKHTFFHESEFNSVSEHETGSIDEEIAFTPIRPEIDLSMPFCNSPWQETVIEADGVVRPCCHIGQPFGDLKKETFEEIWNNTLFCQLRQSVMEGDTCLCDECPTIRKTFLPTHDNSPLSKTLLRLDFLKDLNTDCHPVDPAKKSRFWGDLSPLRYAYNTSWNIRSITEPGHSAPDSPQNLVTKFSTKLHKILFPEIHKDILKLKDYEKQILQRQTDFNAKISEYINLLSDSIDIHFERQKKFNSVVPKHLNLSLQLLCSLQNSIQTLLETFSYSHPKKQYSDVPVDKLSRLFYQYSYEYINLPVSCKVSDPISISIKLTNDSFQPWPADGLYPVNLAYSFCKINQSIPFDAPRIPLPNSIAPGDSLILNFSCIAPGKSDSYQFSWDLVREGIAWFHTFSGSFPSVPISITTSE
ncbi:MAG: hypothetical protein A2161_12975, partial [Candidatus Schekmanbacteria bacterium RBG_13_48_7]